MRILLVPCLLALVPLNGMAGYDAAPAAEPPVSISLQDRHGHVTPVRTGFTHTGGGNLDVAQPTPDTLIITMNGVVVAGGHPCKDSVATMTFDLEQCLEISFAAPKLKRAKLTVEARAIGLLRGPSKGTGTASLASGMRHGE